MENENMWEVYDQASNCITQRMKVDGGWLFTLIHNQLKQMQMCFVPDVDLQRYQSHLRDAYNQGFKDGQSDAAAQFNRAMDISSIPKDFVNAHNDSLACCRHGVPVKFNTCTVCAIARLKGDTI
jgi:hypothetical protein